MQQLANHLELYVIAKQWGYMERKEDLSWIFDIVAKTPSLIPSNLFVINLSKKAMLKL